MTYNPPFPRRLVRLGASIMVAGALLGGAAGCSDDADAHTMQAAAVAAGPEPKTLEGARTAAQTMFDRFSGGDFAGSWDMYTTKGKQAISQADYIKLNETCARKGIAIQLTSARMQGTDRAIVIARQLMAVQSYTMVYEVDSWKLDPAKEGLALYARGVAKAIAAQRKAGTCATA